MDSQPQPSSIPSRHFGTSTTFWVFFWVLFVAAAIMGIYLLSIFRYLPWSNSNPRPTIDIVWVIQSNDSATWYEVTGVNAKPVAHTPLPNMSITGIARGGGKTFVLALANDLSSTLYEYSGSSYTPLYKSPSTLYGLNVSSDGALVTFVSLDASHTRQILAFIPATKELSALNPGYGPAVLQTSSVKTIVYLEGNSVMAQSLLLDNTWTASTTIYTTKKMFPPLARVASDGKSTFAFTDPFVNTNQLWQAKSLDPIVVSPLGIFGTSTPNSSLGFLNGGLFFITAPAAGTTTPVSVYFSQLTPLTHNGQITIPTSGELHSLITFISS